MKKKETAMFLVSCLFSSKHVVGDNDYLCAGSARLMRLFFEQSTESYFEEINDLESFAVQFCRELLDCDLDPINEEKELKRLLLLF